MPNSFSMQRRYLVQTREAVIATTAFFLLLGASWPSVSAEQLAASPGSAAIKAKILKPIAWDIRYTYSKSPSELNEWMRVPSVFQPGCDKLMLRMHSYGVGPFESEVRINDNGFVFKTYKQGDVEMMFDALDSEHPFKGEKNGYTFWFIPLF